MKIDLVRAWADRHDAVTLTLVEGATVADALTAAGWDIAPDVPVGIWGKGQGRDRTLRDGDRVEIYRPLVADPKTARRKRATR
ncbi:MAG: RnfH family protein [Burkholderiales bacterium]|nr:RnfH family protein [Burkholderiales bacterium]